MTMSAFCTVTFFFTNLRLGLGLSAATSGSVTAATATERRALTALPDLAPKRACCGEQKWIDRGRRFSQSCSRRCTPRRFRRRP